MQFSRFLSITLLSAALGFAGCYAKHFPQDGEAPPAPSSATLVPLVVGVLREVLRVTPRTAGLCPFDSELPSA